MTPIPLGKEIFCGRFDSFQFQGRFVSMLF